MQAILIIVIDVVEVLHSPYQVDSDQSRRERVNLIIS